jgi:glycerate 2-kinase
MSATNSQQFRDDAIAIWQAGVDAVRAPKLVHNVVHHEGDVLIIGEERLPIADIGRIAVVGAGKAGAGMAAGLEEAIGEDLLDRLSGWVNVPDDCVLPLAKIHLHGARPAGMNEPTEQGVAGAERILDIVGSLAPNDLCIVLISGGGSALLPAPVEGVTLADKQAITRSLSQAGATINELNCVRKQLSRIKGGRLAAVCTAGRMITLIISDVIGDPLDVIASGPTVPDTSTAADALEILARYSDRLDVPESITRHLQQSVSTGGRVSAADGPASGGRGILPPQGQASEGQTRPRTSGERRTTNLIIGNIDKALGAAAAEAGRRGYQMISFGGSHTGIAREVGVCLAETCLSFRDTAKHPVCLVSGGEPTAQIVPTDLPRKGGRNQELILAATRRLWDENMEGIVLLSGGTDGEDGPTDAAGAFVDAEVIARAKELSLDPAEFLAINNSYPFFEQTGGLLRTGPTHTNVMDLRVGIVLLKADSAGPP